MWGGVEEDERIEKAYCSAGASSVRGAGKQGRGRAPPSPSSHQPPHNGVYIKRRKSTGEGALCQGMEREGRNTKNSSTRVYIFVTQQKKKMKAKEHVRAEGSSASWGVREKVGGKGWSGVWGGRPGAPAGGAGEEATILLWHRVRGGTPVHTHSMKRCHSLGPFLPALCFRHARTKKDPKTLAWRVYQNPEP